jgi:hypothetical protein
MTVSPALFAVFLEALFGVPGWILRAGKFLLESGMAAGVGWGIDVVLASCDKRAIGFRDD